MLRHDVESEIEIVCAEKQEILGNYGWHETPLLCIDLSHDMEIRISQIFHPGIKSKNIKRMLYPYSFYSNKEKKQD